MQRFYFHLNYLHNFIVDLEGAEYPDLQLAKSEAVQGIRELAANCLRWGEEFKLGSVRICDPDGTALEEVFVQEALAAIIPVSAVPSGPIPATFF